MPHNINKISKFWQELKRRNVVRRNTVYAGVAFIILELVSIVVEPLNLPDWTLRAVIILLSIGFIVSIIFSWIYEKNPNGEYEMTKSLGKVGIENKQVTSSGWKIASIISFIVIIGLIVLNILPHNRQSQILDNLEKSIAVLPFENMSDHESNMHLGGAFTDEIIMELQKIKAFDRVLSRTSTMQFKDNRPAIPEIAEKLGVNYIIEGSIQRHKDDVSIRVQVIRAKNEDHIWGDEYDGKWKDIFSIQDEIALNVANELKAILSPVEVDRIEKIPTKNIEAYNLYLQARYFWHSYEKPALDKSLEYYLQAVELDPGFALAYSGLAITYETYSGFGYVPRDSVMPQARMAALKALELDNTSVEVHVALAWIQLADWNWAESERGFKRAIEINPNYAFAHYGYSWYLTYVEKLDAAIEETKRALELDPLDINTRTNLGRRFYFKRDYALAIKEYRKILEVSPDSWFTRSQLALALSQRGFHNEAIEEFSEIEHNMSIQYLFGFIYGQAGKREKALEILNQYLDLAKIEFVPPMHIAFIYIGLGETDHAFEWIEKTYEQREGWLDHIKVEPMFDNLRSDPRFQDLEERMNFPE